MKDQSYKLFLRNEIPKQSQAFDAVTASFSSNSGVSFGEPSHGPKYPRVGLEVQFQGLKNSQELRKKWGGVENLWALKHWLCFCISFLIMPTTESVNNILTRLLVFLFFFFLHFFCSLVSSCQILSPNASLTSHRWPLNTCIWKSAHIWVSAEPLCSLGRTRLTVESGNILRELSFI